MAARRLFMRLTDATMHDDHDPEYETLLRYSLGRIDGFTAARRLGLGSHSDVEMASARARLPRPRLSLVTEQAMAEQFATIAMIASSPASPGTNRTRVLSIGALTSNEEILVRYSRGTMTAADATVALHQDSLAELYGVMERAGISLPTVI